MPDSERWRVFCAVDISEEIRQRIAQHVSQLKKAAPDVSASWTRVESIHLTLKFFGEIKPERVAGISEILSNVTGQVEPFRILIEEAGAFPSHGPPRVLWIGIGDPEGALQKLQALVEDGCAKAGFPKEDRPFHPHLTVARLRKPQGVRALASAHQQLGFPSIEMTVGEVLLMRSELHPHGSKYSIISKHKLVR
jgi:2'-5' RNA ligase